MASDRFNRAELKRLIDAPAGPCASLYMPAHRKGPETRQDPIRLKNLLREAEAQLAALGLRAPEVRALVEPGRALLDDTRFWAHQADGLALFLGHGLARAYRVPLALDELVVVTSRFHLKPLLRLLTGDGRFYVLALSQNELRMLEGSRDLVREVPLEGIPTSLADALRLDDPEKQLQFHTGAPGVGGGRAAIFHGHGAAADDVKPNLLRYFLQVNAGLREMLVDDTAPLVLAGVDYLLPIYREANTYAHLTEGGLPGSPESQALEELHARAWELVGPLFDRARDEAAAAYRRLAGTGRTSRHIPEVAAAASQGRVEILFAAAGVQRWGQFDPGAQQATLHEERQPGDEDLLDFAAVHSLVNGGAAYIVGQDRMPEDAVIAAVFRY